MTAPMGIRLQPRHFALTLADASGGVDIRLGTRAAELVLALTPVLGDGRPTTVELQVPAAAAVGGSRVVRAVAGGADYASRSVLAHADTVLGVTRNAASTGATLYIVREGAIEDAAWTWTPDAPVYLDTNGLMTQTLPTSGYQLQIGVALSATELLVSLQPPIHLQ